MKRITIHLFVFFMITIGCATKEHADLLIYNALVYTVDNQFSTAEAFAVKDGKFIDVGTTSQIRSKYNSAKEIDMQGAPVYPGFHDAHSHFIALGKSFARVNLRGAASYEEVLARVAEYYEIHKTEWIVGTGWDQNLWQNPVFPTNQELNLLYPNTPVILTRIDGHALVANEAAILKVGIKPGEASILPGEAPIRNGKFTGIFLENSADRFKSAIPEPTEEELTEFILEAAKKCYKYGLTSVSDAGLSLSAIQLLDSLHQKGVLSLRVEAWLEPSDENFERFKSPYRTDRLTVSCVKLYMDGALGSRGAWMLQPYDDEPSTTGIRVITDDLFLEYCQKAYDAGLQVATHCIGDAAVKKTIEHYACFLKGDNDLRWRIEHAQIVAPEDFENFKKYSIVPSVQPTHATSDMFWAADRVGDRISGGYSNKDLKEQLGWIAFGTDFPIEEVNPIHTFFAAVFRKNLEFLPEGGFLPENAVSREDALRAMTIWAAKASFDEKSKGSIEKGKWADFVILDRDIMKEDETKIPETKVVEVYISGERVVEQDLVYEMQSYPFLPDTIKELEDTIPYSEILQESAFNEKKKELIEFCDMFVSAIQSDNIKDVSCVIDFPIWVECFKDVKSGDFIFGDTITVDNYFRYRTLLFDDDFFRAVMNFKVNANENSKIVENYERNSFFIISTATGDKNEFGLEGMCRVFRFENNNNQYKLVLVFCAG